MRYDSYPDEPWANTPARRRLIVAAGAVLLLLTFLMLAGPSNVLVLLHLKDLETETAPEREPGTPAILTVEQVRARVVNTRPRLEPFAGFPSVQRDMAGSRFVFFAVESGLELEFRLEGDDIRSVTLYWTAKKDDRLVLTDGVTGAVFDLFVQQEP